MAMLSRGEMLRRVYREVVRRRSCVRITAATETQLKFAPIFVIGVYRSGTTLLRYIVDSHSHICCPPESNFIGTLSPIINDELSSAGLAAMGFDEEHVVQRLRQFCEYFFNNYAASCNKQRWADKSTSHVDHLDFILRLFPEAQFVMIYRHGLDQAHSFTRGGNVLEEALKPYSCDGEDVRIAAVRYWREKTESILEFEKHHPDSCTRVLYEELCASPEETLKPVFDFVGEPWEPDVLQFHRFQHDKGPEHGRTVTTRGFSVRKGHYHSWPPQLVEQCMCIAEPTMERLGYTI